MWGLCKGLCCRCCCAGKKRGRLKVHEVTAKDYMHQKKKVKARLREDNMTKATLRSFGGYSIGMLLITIYAGIVLFVKNYNLWYCLISTITTGFFLTLGMGFSKRVRITVLLMLPSFFSSQGKNFLLLMAFAMALQGPVANVLENFRRSTKALSCGVELAINQTKDLLEKIKRPLISTLNYIKKIGRNLKKASDMIRKFFKTIMTGIKFIGRSLRRVWHFIANMGEICNEEMEAPYIKCKKLFDEGKRKCQKVMTFLAFLCFIVDIFRPLCGLAKVIVLLCIIPFYVNKFIQKCIKNPVMALLNKVKMKFEFNITVIHDFDITTNSSKTLMRVAKDIMNEVQANLDPYLELFSMFSYSMTIISFMVYIMALKYRKKYLFKDSHDNIYITRNFIELDVMRARQGRRTLLPLGRREAYRFIRPGSLYLTRYEKRGYSFSIFNIFRHLLIVTFLVLIDYIIYWVLDMLRYLLQGEVVAR
ncbi:DC-STAMP domain-containing protein 2-like, partial [Ascaphus truei]|uniref:DC-STAMP domain-containing protein 2-like n=1 Tax=Ascaphus truei TaxID=8439 RepID=UPI003F59B212